MKKNNPASQTEFLLYTSAIGDVKADVCLKDETVWLTQKSTAPLFGVKIPAVNKHLKNIFDSGELHEDAVISILEITATDGKKNKGKVSALEARLKSEKEYDSYRVVQDREYVSDFDKEVKRLTGKEDDER